jgi:hypothetical protein
LCHFLSEVSNSIRKALFGQIIILRFLEPIVLV